MTGSGFPYRRVERYKPAIVVVFSGLLFLLSDFSFDTGTTMDYVFVISMLAGMGIGFYNSWAADSPVESAVIGTVFMTTLFVSIALVGGIHGFYIVLLALYWGTVTGLPVGTVGHVAGDVSQVVLDGSKVRWKRVALSFVVGVLLPASLVVFTLWMGVPFGVPVVG